MDCRPKPDRFRGSVERPAGYGSVAWKINSEIVLLLGWSPAILAQLAHPLVAAGVADHSLFLVDPRGRHDQRHPRPRQRAAGRVGRPLPARDDLLGPRSGAVALGPRHDARRVP